MIYGNGSKSYTIGGVALETSATRWVENIAGKDYLVGRMPDGKVWMLENLDYVWDGLTVITSGSMGYGEYATYYNYDEATYGWGGLKYGLYYNGVSARALTLEGWHVPLVTEVQGLAVAVGGTPRAGGTSYYDGAGTILKSTESWTLFPGTDNYGFNAKAHGQKTNYNGPFSGVGTYSPFYLKNAYSTLYQYYFFFSGSDYDPNNQIGCLSISSQADSWYSGYPIRLVKD